MKILSLKLKGYKRLDLLGADTLTWTPKSPYQLILGTNGAGKSSILNELSPLPIESSALRENGYKIIEIEHRDIKYTISYHLHKKIDCSFIRDGKELNDGGTIKVQKDLILEHFNYDSNLHDLLIGYTLLSNMSPSQRREWFVKMSKADMTYALSVFSKLKSAERDIRGAIKLNNQRLVSEQAKLPSTEDVVRIKQDNELKQKELNHLLPFLQQGVVDVTGKFSDALTALENTSSSLLSLKLTTQYNEYGFSDIDVLIDIERDLSYKNVELRNRYKKATEELAEMQDMVAKNKQLTDRPLEQIDVELDKLNNELRSLNNVDRSIVANTNIAKQLYHFNQVKEAVFNVLQTMPPNPETNGEKLYNRQKYDKLSNELAELNATKIELTNRLSYFEKELIHLNEVHDVNCPNCHHRFKPGVDCSRLDELKQLIPNERIKLAETNQAIEKCYAVKEEFDTWVKSMKQYRSLQERYIEFNNLFAFINESELFSSYPLSAMKLIDKYHEALVTEDKTIQLCKEINKLEEERIRRLAAEGQDMEYIYKRMQQLEDEITHIHQEGKFVSSEINKVASVINSHKALSEKRTAVLAIRDEIQALTLEQVKYENNKRLQGIISEKQQQLAINERFVSEITQSETIITQLSKTREELAEEQKALQILTTLLSPQDGLIAESLIGFINQFLNEMANVLDQIWVYEMRPYLDIDEEGIDLDYRFKVDIEGLEEAVSDVSRLSRGQKEIVDFVFKLLLMHHLDMQDYPLFMDEVGGTFDATHRDRLYRYIKLLVEGNQCQQVFIISHIASSHDALTTADRCVLDADAKMVTEESNPLFILE